MQHPEEPSSSARCLHLVAGAGHGALEDCLAQTAAGDYVVFLDAGVLHLLRPAAALPAGAGEVFFADADLRAHGLLEVARDARAGVIDDAGVCALLARCEHCLTWS
jgi:sulfur transfer complex TusBCD TusB component (DsrH family)